MRIKLDEPSTSVDENLSTVQMIYDAFHENIQSLVEDGNKVNELN